MPMRLRDEQGMMAIGIVIMLMFVLPLFGGVLWQYSMAELKRVEGMDQDIQALFLAQAGAELFMGAVKQRASSDPMPYGSMEPVYYDLSNNRFTSDKPTDFLGPIHVEIREEDATEGGERRVTVIEATATVGSTRRTVKLVTYPVRYGHDNSLLWYEENSGLVTPSTGKAPKDLVIMRTKPPEDPKETEGHPIHFGSGVLWERDPFMAPTKSITTTANTLVFDSKLQLVLDASSVERSDDGQFSMVLEAERVFFHGLEIAYLPAKTLIGKISGLPYPRPARNYVVKMTLPTIDGETMGKLGSEIADKVDQGIVDPDARYGEVYFDKEHVTYKVYEWYWRNWLSIGVKERTSDTEKNIARLFDQGFFFRDGWTFDVADYLESDENNTNKYFDRLEAEGWLLRIKEEHEIDRSELDGLQPFFWDQ